MITVPNTGRRWALSPIDSRSHLLTEADGAPIGMLVTDCGQLLPCEVDTSPHPPAGLRCTTCARGMSQDCVQLPVTGADSATGSQVSVTEDGRARYAQLRDTRQLAELRVPEPRFPTTGPAPTGHRPGTPSPVAGGRPDPIRGSGPAMHWARCPIDGHLHAIEPTDIAQVPARGYAEALCGHRLPAEGLAIQDVPSGALCLPCVIGVTADMPDPGRMGTAQ